MASTRFLYLAAVLGWLAGCSPAPAPSTATPASSSPKKLNIVCTVSMVTDIVRQVAGEHAEVTGLLNEGVDPHLYVPTTSDTGRAREADVVAPEALR